MALYSYQGGEPAPLPTIPGTNTAIIHVSGVPRTDGSTFTAQEMADAGYTGPHEKPSFDEATHNAPNWNGSAWVVPSKSVAERKTWLKAKATEKFREMRDAGTTYSGTPISTTHDAIVELREGLEKINSTMPAGTINVVTRSGAKLTLGSVNTHQIITAIQDYVADCQEREHALHTAIDAAADHAALDAIDINSGWPT